MPLGIPEKDKIKTTLWPRKKAKKMIEEMARELDKTMGRYVQDLVYEDCARRNGSYAEMQRLKVYAVKGTEHEWDTLRHIAPDAEVYIVYFFNDETQEWHVSMSSAGHDVMTLFQNEGVECDGNEQTASASMPMLPFRILS